ncbi:MAG: hypothetical protein ABI398_04830 [Devosia sp.]
MRHSIIAAALIVSGIVSGLGQGWLVPVVFILALGAILWWDKLRADAARGRRGKK